MRTDSPPDVYDSAFRLQLLEVAVLETMLALIREGAPGMQQIADKWASHLGSEAAAKLRAQADG